MNYWDSKTVSHFWVQTQALIWPKLLSIQLKYKKRVYKMLNLDEKQLKNLHTKV